MDDNIWKFIEESLFLIERQRDRLDKAAEGLMISPESPLIDAHGRIEERLIDALELLMDDDWDTISWFVYECEFGRHPLEAEVGGKMIAIDSYKALRYLLENETIYQNCDIDNRN